MIKEHGITAIYLTSVALNPSPKEKIFIPAFSAALEIASNKLGKSFKSLSSRLKSSPKLGINVLNKLFNSPKSIDLKV